MRETSDLAVWDLAGIPIVVGNLGTLQNARISPLWESPLGLIPPDPTCFAHERGTRIPATCVWHDVRRGWMQVHHSKLIAEFGSRCDRPSTCVLAAQAQEPESARPRSMGGPLYR